MTEPLDTDTSAVDLLSNNDSDQTFWRGVSESVSKRSSEKPEPESSKVGDNILHILDLNKNSIKFCMLSFADFDMLISNLEVDPKDNPHNECVQLTI